MERELEVLNSDLKSQIRDLRFERESVMPRTAVADRLRLSAKFAAIAVVAAAGLTISGPATTPVFAELQPIAQIDPDAPDAAGKDHNEFVFVRDSAIATEKLALAEKMERL